MTIAVGRAAFGRLFRLGAVRRRDTDRLPLPLAGRGYSGPLPVRPSRSIACHQADVPVG